MRITVVAEFPNEAGATITVERTVDSTEDPFLPVTQYRWRCAGCGNSNEATVELSDYDTCKTIAGEADTHAGACVEPPRPPD
ncbi:hypothetical protein [Streptomyces sp. NPDC053048]|uniref:hypothetical protein n=1 Tax=Streptomyces sp. NPDC053048 TaxID=3365694 RepID=UPI0037D7AC69